MTYSNLQSRFLTAGMSGDHANLFAFPEPRELLAAELEESHLLRQINDEIQVYLVKGLECSSVMREIGRLREVAFQAVGEGTGAIRDVDAYDEYYQQIVLWNAKEHAIIGGYRIAKAIDIIQHKGVEGLYNHRLFQFHDDVLPKLSSGLELGRSFISPEHWGRRNLDYLWMGIGAYLAENQDIRYLFGAVSISDDFPRKAKIAIAHFYDAYFGLDNPIVSARNVFPLPSRNPYFGDNYTKEFKHLKQVLNSYGVSIPPLYKHYSELADMDGVSVLGFNIDEYFNNSVDGLMVVDCQKIKRKKAQRYIPNISNIADSVKGMDLSGLPMTAS